MIARAKQLSSLNAMGANAVNSMAEALTPLIDNKSFPLLAHALAEENPRAVAGVAWALASSRNYSPSLLLELLSQPGVSRPAVLDVIGAHKKRFQLRDLLNAAYQQEGNEKAALFRIAGDLVDDSSVDELLSRVHGKDAIARTHIIALLARFGSPKVVAALSTTLKDPNKLVRAAALKAIASGNGQVDPAQIAPAQANPPSPTPTAPRVAIWPTPPKRFLSAGRPTPARNSARSKTVWYAPDS